MMWYVGYDDVFRLLEEGKLSEAEAEKHRLEQQQRVRMKRYSDIASEYTPQWFTYVSTLYL